MKTAIFNFMVLQIIIWSIVFSNSNESPEGEVNHASISNIANTTEAVTSKGHSENAQDCLQENPNAIR